MLAVMYGARGKAIAIEVVSNACSVCSAASVRRRKGSCATSSAASMS